MRGQEISVPSNWTGGGRSNPASARGVPNGRRGLGVLLAASLSTLALASAAGANHVVMHGGPFNRVVVSLVPHPGQPRVLYLATFGGGIFKSVDGGRRWTALGRGLEDPNVLTLAIDPVAPDRLWAGTDSGVFASRDGGATWARRGPTLVERNIRSLLIAPNGSGVLYAATDQGIFWSRDGGTRWAPRGGGIPSTDLRALRADPRHSGRLFAAGFGGVFRSDDAGRRWSSINRGLTDLRVRALALDPSRPGVVYAGTAGGGVFETLDAGGHWQAVNEGLDNLTILSLLVTPAGERFAGTVGGVYRRASGAGAWEPVGQDVLTLTITFIVDDPHRAGTLYAGTGGLIFVSEDHGRRWRELAVTVAREAAPASAAAATERGAHVHSWRERR